MKNQQNCYKPLSISQKLHNLSRLSLHKQSIKNQLQDFHSYTKFQIITLSRYYQQKQQSIVSLYQQQISDLKNQIQRQYNIIGLMKQQLIDLMQLFNQNQNKLSSRIVEKNQYDRDFREGDQRQNDFFQESDPIFQSQPNLPLPKNHPISNHKGYTSIQLQTIFQQQTQRTLYNPCQDNFQEQLENNAIRIDEESDNENFTGFERQNVKESDFENVEHFNQEKNQEFLQKQSKNISFRESVIGAYPGIRINTQQQDQKQQKQSISKSAIISESNMIPNHSQPIFEYEQQQQHPQLISLPQQNQNCSNQKIFQNSIKNLLIYNQEQLGNKFDHKDIRNIKNGNLTNMLQEIIGKTKGPLPNTACISQASKPSPIPRPSNKQNIIPVSRQTIYQINSLNERFSLTNQQGENSKIKKETEFIKQFKKSFGQCMIDMMQNSSKPSQQQKPKTKPKFSSVSERQLFEFYNVPANVKSPVSENFESLSPRFHNNHPKHQIEMIRLTTNQNVSISDMGQDEQQQDYFLKACQPLQQKRSLNYPNSFEKEFLFLQAQQSRRKSTGGHLSLVHKQNENSQKSELVSRKSSANTKSQSQTSQKKKSSLQNGRSSASHTKRSQAQKLINLPSPNQFSVQQKQFQLLQNMISNLQPIHKFLVGAKKLQIKYDGQKNHQNQRHGHGILQYSNGLSYEGQFRQNQRQGYGILKFNHILLYSGTWFKDQLYGQGKIRNCAIINKQKSINSSNSNNLLMNKWISYTGGFLQNKFQGEGVLYLQGGQKFVGKFENGGINGEGNLHRKNGQIEKGIWKNGILVQRFDESMQN